MNYTEPIIPKSGYIPPGVNRNNNNSINIINNIKSEEEIKNEIIEEFED